MVQFIVGPKKELFTAHKNFVIHHSPVFEAAFSKCFIEGQTKAYALNETEPRTFEMFLEWVYGQNIIPSLPFDHFSIDPMAYCRLWILADKYQVPRLQNEIMRFLWRLKSSIPVTPVPVEKEISHDNIQEIYDKTMNGSPLRMFLAEHMAAFGLEAPFPIRQAVEDRILTQEMLVDILEACQTIVPKNTALHRIELDAFLVSEEVPDIKKGRLPEQLQDSTFHIRSSKSFKK
jgi:hypothetical protein